MSSSDFDKPETEINVPESGSDVPESESDIPAESEPEASQQEKPSPELVFDRGYSWVVCFCSFLLNFNTWGMNSGFAIYFSHYITYDTFPGASKLDYAAIGGLAFGLGLLLCPFINFLQGYMGIRNTIILGNCIQFTAVMLASFSRKLWQLYLTQGLLQSLGLAIISVPGVTIIPQYFKKRRVLAGGIGAAGSGMGGIVYNLGMQKIVEVKSVFWALRAQSIISFGLVWIAIILFRDRSQQHNIQFSFFDRAVLSNVGFWLATLYIVSCMFGYVVVLYTLANFTVSLGYSPYQGSISAAMVQLGSVIGRPIIGHFSDKLGPTTVISFAYTIVTILTLAMWIPSRNFATIIAFAVIMGALMGSVFATIAPFVARLVGLKKMNITFSMLWAFLGVAGAVSPVIGVALLKNTVGPSQYVYCTLFSGLSFVVCTITLFILRGYILGRDEVLHNEADTDHDLQEVLSIKVPFGLMMRRCFKFRNVKV